MKENPDTSPLKERVGHLDIETTNLKANFAIVISYAIKCEKGILGRAITPDEMHKGIYDKNLLADCVKDMKTFDRLVVYWGKDRRFDIPTLRTRCIYYGLDFPLYKDIKVTDMWDAAKNKLNLHSRRLEAVCEFYNIPAKKHPLKPSLWIDVMSGKKKALDWVWEHNKEDVISLEAVYNLLTPYMAKSNTSI